METGLPVYGQDKARETKHEKQNSDDRKNPEAKSGSTVETGNTSTINELTTKGKEERKTNEPEAYLRALISPNNLPNVILAAVGVMGIFFARRTLNWLKKQTIHISQQADLMQQTLTEMTDANANAKTFNNASIWRLDNQTSLMAAQANAMDAQRRDSNQSSAEALKLMEAQAELMTRQADIMERQTKLQEAAMTQWIAVQNWKVNPDPVLTPSHDDPRTLHIRYEIVNESNFPLTIRAEFKFFGSLPGAVKQYLSYAYLLPKRPYPISFDLNVRGEHAERYTNGELIISVHGKFFHVGVTNQPSPLMAIHGNLVCGRAAPTRLEFESIEMVRASGGDQPQNKEPN